LILLKLSLLGYPILDFGFFISFSLVPRLCLGKHVQRLCLEQLTLKLEAEPTDLRYQALPGNE
jgi:hypothetical protein